MPCHWRHVIGAVVQASQAADKKCGAARRFLVLCQSTPTALPDRRLGNDLRPRKREASDGQHDIQEEMSLLVNENIKQWHGETSCSGILAVRSYASFKDAMRGCTAQQTGST